MTSSWVQVYKQADCTQATGLASDTQHALVNTFAMLQSACASVPWLASLRQTSPAVDSGHPRARALLGQLEADKCGSRHQHARARARQQASFRQASAAVDARLLMRAPQLASLRQIFANSAPCMQLPQHLQCSWQQHIIAMNVVCCTIVPATWFHRAMRCASCAWNHMAGKPFVG